MNDIKPNIHVQVSASMTATNGVQIAVARGTVTLWKQGPKGGAGATVEIPVEQWAAVNDAVVKITEAMSRVREAVEVEARS